MKAKVQPRSTRFPGTLLARAALACKAGWAGWRPSPLRLFEMVALAFFLGGVSQVQSQTLSDEALQQVRFDQKLGSQVSPSLSFRDEEGREVRLAQYFGHRPVVLELGYYQCPMLCTLVLNGLMESAADMKWSIGREFDVITLSVDPGEAPVLAAAKKRTYLKRYGRPSAAQGWHFLTGTEPAIRQLADEVGFRYVYDPASKQYAHPSGLIVLTPEGKISRYFFGVTYASKDLYQALQQASSSQVGSPIAQFILLCFHYNPITGKYSGTILSCLRWLSGLMLLGLAWLIGRLARRNGVAPVSEIPALAETAGRSISGPGATEATGRLRNPPTAAPVPTAVHPPES